MVHLHDINENSCTFSVGNLKIIIYRKLQQFNDSDSYGMSRFNSSNNTYAADNDCS